eukprot:TRINITY_DN16508_c4_g1_i1.p2 TRINITY_DN16508_c4_g1~~TRINITY_DN16508_c4_g1_i1.p2  ORF type:complete len:109 (+),score=9.72 TRINITY_DN16508_c4_g1_i1:237-563(+)
MVGLMFLEYGQLIEAVEKAVLRDIVGQHYPSRSQSHGIKSPMPTLFRSFTQTDSLCKQTLQLALERNTHGHIFHHIKYTTDFVHAYICEGYVSFGGVCVVIRECPKSV